MTLRAALVASVWLGALFALAATPVADQPAPVPAAPVIYTAVVDGIIHPVSAEYMIQTLDHADRAGAALVVFTLRRRAVWSTRPATSSTRMLAAKTPVAMFVSPAGARAASAGFILTIAADVAAMAPGTHIGAAHPVTRAAARRSDETTAKKADGRRGRLRAHAGGRAPPECDARGGGGPREPRLHRAGGARRVAAAHRISSRLMSPISCGSCDGRDGAALRRHADHRWTRLAPRSCRSR